MDSIREPIKNVGKKNYKHWIFIELLKKPKHGLNQRNPEKIQTKFYMHLSVQTKYMHSIFKEPLKIYHDN